MTLAPPLSLIAELTHRCPLRCIYCSNPTQLAEAAQELQTESWSRVFEQARDLGVMQVSFTGGEPLVRPDVAELVRASRQCNLYVNLITSGIGLNGHRLDVLAQAGLDHIQLSFQDVQEDMGDAVAGARVHSRKLEVAKIIRQSGIGFTLNIVIQRHNIGRIDQMVDMAVGMGAQKLELAHVQYYGWALRNRSFLLPSAQQLAHSLEVVEKAKERARGRLRIEMVVPDYYARYPKACMGGWGSKAMLINPLGKVLPCHAAEVIPGMEFENVRKSSLEWIWTQSSSFQRFRGEAWMQEPCRSCDRRDQDFAGCRCQAFLVAGDPQAADPVCTLSPNRTKIDAILQGSQMPQELDSEHFIRLSSGDRILYRINPS